MQKLIANQEKFEEMLKGYQDYTTSILKNDIPAKGETNMPVKLIKGSLRYRNDSHCWEARVTINYITKSFYSIDKKECIAKANKYYRQNYKTIKLEYSKEIEFKYFNDWLDSWFNTYKIPKLKKSSLPTMISAINKHIKPYFENKLLNKICALDIDCFLNTLKNSRRKETVCTIVCDCLTLAYKKDLIKKPLHLQITKYKHKRTDGHCLTYEEENKLLETLPKVKNTEIVYFVYLTGCRKHGALNLEPNDIDFENKVIHLRETKTPTSDRFFPMTNKLEEFLRKLNLSRNKVFDISDRQHKLMIENLSQACGFRVRLKDLRTTFASRAREKGVAPEVLKKLLGHTSYEITEKYYVKISNAFEQEQIKLLDQDFTTQNTTQKK